MAIRTGLIGYGRNGSTMHSDSIEASPLFEMAAVCDINTEALEKAAKRFACPTYTSYHTMLQTEKLDLVVIVTPSNLHAQMACNCLAAGVHVLVTKPWGLNGAEADAMVLAAKNSGKLLMPWLPARWGCDLTRLKKVIADGLLGEVFQVQRSEFTFGIRNDWQIWAKNGGGYLLNWGPHLVDQPMQLVGGKVQQVFAVTKQTINPGDVEDVFYAVMQMDNGVTITSEYNISTAGSPNWIVRGTKGTAYMRGNNLQVDLVQFPSFIPENTYRCEVTVGSYTETVKGDIYGNSAEVYAHIAEAVLGEKPYAIPLEQACALTGVLDAIRLSAGKGQSVAP
ncbi:MAG: Gfo/Idh/MocA family protein [Oscillospiraceae bacterium]